MTTRPLTKRCRGEHCGYMRKGMSSFPLRRDGSGGRADICKFCADCAETIQRQLDREAARRTRMRIYRLNREERDLNAKLARIEAERTTLLHALGRTG